jgi:4-hydroxymandelate oxidase
MDRRELLQSLAATAAAAKVKPTEPPAAETETGSETQATAQAPASAAGATTAPVNLHEFEALARKRITRMAYDYIAGGGADEVTLRRNRQSFDEIRLKPRVLVDVSKLETNLTLLRQEFAHPILLAPTAYHKLVHREGEVATARGAASAEATLVVSSFATVAIEPLAKSSAARLWFQLYCQPDREFTRELIQRAEAAGCRALVVTVDTPVGPIRDREARVKFELPAGMAMENLASLTAKTGADDRRHIRMYSAVLDPTLTWKTVEWIRGLTRVPVVLKGILAPEDARRAAESGADAIIVSNHGARNLDTSPATIEALPRAAEAVQGRVPLLMDGGVRRGTDVLKALALGASAVLIGRPYLWGLGSYGADGVKQVVEMLRTELEVAMALAGKTTLAQVNRDVLW